MFSRFQLSTLFFLTISSFCWSSSSSVLDKNEMERAKDLAKSSTKFELYRDQFIADLMLPKNNPNKRHWITLEKKKFSLKKKAEKLFLMANGFDYNQGWGEIAIYRKRAEDIKYSFGQFSDVVGSDEDVDVFLSNLRYEYIPSKENKPAYFIIEKVETQGKFQGKGYSQACLNYFIDFVKSRTDVKLIISDLRNPVCQGYFPKYAFESGLPAEFETTDFKRVPRCPYYLNLDKQK